MIPLARLLSYALHPLLMPVLTLWVALELDPDLGIFFPKSWHSDGNVAEAARRLQTDRPNLYRRMRRLGLA